MSRRVFGVEIERPAAVRRAGGRRLVAGAGQDRQVKGAALDPERPPLRPTCVPPIGLGQPLGDRKAETRAAVFAAVGGVGLAERLEHPAHRLGAMPMPVSLTAICSSKPPSGAAVPSARSETTLPRSVNLTELVSRFRRIWRRRLTSPMITGRGRRRRPRAVISRPFSPASERISATAPSMHSRRLNGDRLELHPAGLDLREVEDVVDDREQRLARSADDRRLPRAARRRGRCRSSRPLIPITAFIGVRISWLIAARNVLLAALAASAAVARLLGARVQPRIVERDHGQLGEPLEPLDVGLRERPLIGGVASDSERAERRVAR